MKRWEDEQKPANSDHRELITICATAKPTTVSALYYGKRGNANFRVGLQNPPKTCTLKDGNLKMDSHCHIRTSKKTCCVTETVALKKPQHLTDSCSFH